MIGFPLTGRQRFGPNLPYRRKPGTPKRKPLDGPPCRFTSTREEHKRLAIGNIVSPLISSQGTPDVELRE